MSPPAGCRESSRKGGREMLVNPAPPLEPASPLDKKSNTETCPNASCLAPLGRLETCLLFTPPASCRKVGVAAEMDARGCTLINRSARPFKARQRWCHTQTNHTQLGVPGCASIGPPPPSPPRGQLHGKPTSVEGRQRGAPQLYGTNLQAAGGVLGSADAPDTSSSGNRDSGKRRRRVNSAVGPAS